MDNFLSPIKTLYMYFPVLFVFRILVVVALCVLTVMIANRLTKVQKIDKTQKIALIFTGCYYTVIVFFTVLGRRTKEDFYPVKIGIVEQFQDVFIQLRSGMILEIALNVLMFVPLSISLCVLLKNTKYCKIKFFAIAILLSLNIEILQLILRSGYCEISDVCKYLTGVLFGVLLYFLYIKTADLVQKQKTKQRKQS